MIDRGALDSVSPLPYLAHLYVRGVRYFRKEGKLTVSVESSSHTVLYVILTLKDDRVIGRDGD